MKKIILLALAAIMLLLPLSSCKGKGDSAETLPPEENTGETYYLNTLSKGDFDYEDFVIATIDSNCELGEWKEDGNEVDLQLYKRDTKMKEYFEIEIKYVELSSKRSEALTSMQQYARDYESAYVDCYIQQAQNLMTLAVAGLLYDLNSVHNLNLDNGGWWNQSVNDNLELNEKLYVAAGPIAQWYYGAPFVLAFNKTVMNNYGLPDIYTMVQSDAWTLEEMQKLCHDYGIYNLDLGMYAVSVNNQANYCMYASAGGTFCTVDNDGISVSLANEASMTLLENIIKACDPDESFSGGLTQSAEMFTTGKALFWRASLGYVGQFLPSSEVDYGIIPCPKASTAQADYISCGWSESSFFFSIPNSLSESRREWTGLLAEAYAFLAYDLVKPVKYDSFVKYQVANDPIASEMMDIIFDGLYFDLNTVLNFGGSRDLVGEVLYGTVSTNRFSSRLKSIQTAIDGDISDYEALTKSGNS